MGWMSNFFSEIKLINFRVEGLRSEGAGDPVGEVAEKYRAVKEIIGVYNK